jgi:hypothetical protein
MALRRGLGDAVRPASLSRRAFSASSDSSSAAQQGRQNAEDSYHDNEDGWMDNINSHIVSAVTNRQENNFLEQ